MAIIDYHSEVGGFDLESQEQLTGWIEKVLDEHEHEIDEISFVFLSDEELLEMNREHLDHDTYTDILTFVMDEEELGQTLVDIFISVDRVRENAEEFGASFKDELHRVMIHGVLHAIGLDDKDPDAKAGMRKAEDYALSLREF